MLLTKPLPVRLNGHATYTSDCVHENGFLAGLGFTAPDVDLISSTHKATVLSSRPGDGQGDCTT